MTEKLFVNSKAGKVCCNYNETPNCNSVVIISHGYLSNKNSRTGVALAEKMNAAGVSTLALDLYGHGESEGDIEHLTLSKAVENVRAVYAFAKSKNYKKIGLVGSSFSGAVSLIVASMLPFDVLSLKCPVFDYTKLWSDRLGHHGIEKWKMEGFVTLFEKKVRFGAFEDAKTYDMNSIGQSITAPTLVIHGDRDTTVPLSHPQGIIASIASKDKKLVIVKGADHFFISPLHFKQLVEESSEWLINYLK